MREGLRSRTRLGNVSGGGVGEKESSGGVQGEAVDLGSEDSGAQGDALEPAIEKEDVVTEQAEEECEVDLGVSSSGKGDVGLAEDGNGGGCEEDDDVDRNAKREDEGLNGRVLSSGRVLRSRMKQGDDGKSCSGGDVGGVVSWRSRESSGLGRVMAKRECEEGDEFVDDGSENERVEPMKKQNKLKRKRGRPPKKREEGDEFVHNGSENERVEPMKKQNGKGELKRKRGRPPKVKLEEQGELAEQLPPRKRGRPPKACKGNCLPTVAHSTKGNVGRRKGRKGRKGKKGLTTRDGTNVSRRSAGEELEKKRFYPVQKNKLGKFLKTEDNGVASPVRSNNGNTLNSEKMKRSEVRLKVREQIWDRLSAAGWTVEYRPRNGKEYEDAVYVSLDGKTHWSITLAYNRLKDHYEAGDGEGKFYGPGFKFTPIPEEDFKILTKIMTKKRRCDKGKGRGEKDGKTVDGVNRKLDKGKPGTRAGKGKSGKERMKRKRKRSQIEEDNADVTSPKRMPLLVRDHKRHKTQNKKRCPLMVRNAEVDIDSEVDGYVPYSGKRTVLAWMIDLGTVLQNGKVHYMEHIRQRASVDGKITGDGIHCGCCNEIVTISDFEAHTGSKLSDPLKNIHIEGGTSLLQCLLDSWNKQEESERKGFHFVDVAGEDPNDDSCGVCGDGGDLICCDGCPSTFHQSCLDINKFPSGDWHCVYCCCKFCGSVGGSSNQRDCDDDFAGPTLLTCHLCEEKYHRSCVVADGAKTDDSGDAFFCGNNCQELSERLEMLLGVKHEIEDGFSVTFIRRSDVGIDASQTKPHIVECNSKLAVALSVMDECFMPYIDHRSGINLIHSIVYNCGSNFKRLNYSGFVTAILEKGDEIISAASIRIHGNQLAEMPFIGTRYMHRRKGMCRRLLNGIECVLSSLNVELLVIPAISELRETWTSVFGFEQLELTNKKIIQNMSLLVFPHVDMLQKKVPSHKFAGENMITTEVSNLQNSHTVDKVANCEGEGASGSDLIISAGQINGKKVSIESGGGLPDDSLDNAPDITSNTIHHNESPKDVTCEVVCHENLPVEEQSTANAPDCVNDNTCDQAADISTHKNTNHDDCIVPDHEKPIDLHGQLNNCCVTHEERKSLKGGCVSGEAVLTSNASVHVKSQSITEDLPVNHEKNSVVVSAPDADEAEVCSAEMPNLQTDTNSGDYQSIPVSPVSSEKIVDGVDGNSKASSAAEASSLPADTDIVPNNEHSMKGSLEPAGPDLQADQTAPPADTDIVPNNEHSTKGSPEPAEPDLQADETARSNAPSLSTPNAAAGVSLHCASAGAGTAACGSTEVIVLSNQAS